MGGRRLPRRACRFPGKGRREWAATLRTRTTRPLTRATTRAATIGIGPGSPGGGQGDDGVDGGFQGTGVSLDLSEEEPALEHGEQRYCEVVGGDARRQVPGGLEGA